MSGLVMPGVVAAAARRAEPFDPLTYEYDSAELRAFSTVADASVSGGHVTGLTDRTAFGNDATVPTAVTEGPTVESSAWRGNDCILFDGVGQGLAIESFNWGSAGASGSITIVLLIQVMSIDGSKSPFAVGGQRPFFRTANPGLAFAADTGITNPSASSNSVYGRSCIAGMLDTVNEVQSLWTEGTKDDEQASTDPGNAMEGATVTFGYEGTAASAEAGSHCNMRLRGYLIFKGALTDAEHALIATWAEGEKGAFATAQTVDILLAGQSNCTPEALSPRSDVLLPRRDIVYSKDFEKASGSLRETRDSGALTYAREAELEDYLGSALMYDLIDTDRIDATLITVGRTGTGFRVNNNPSLVDQWMPPSSNGGTGETVYNRSVAVWNTNDRAAGLNVCLWCHGETDARSNDGTGDYQTNLENLIDDWLSDLDGWTASNVLFLIVGLTPEYDDNTDGSRQAAVRAAMDAVAAARSYVQVIDVDGEGLQVDNIHYSAALCDAVITAARGAIKTRLGIS